MYRKVCKHALSNCLYNSCQHYAENDWEIMFALVIIFFQVMKLENTRTDRDNASRRKGRETLVMLNFFPTKKEFSSKWMDVQKKNCERPIATARAYAICNNVRYTKPMWILSETNRTEIWWLGDDRNWLCERNTQCVKPDDTIEIYVSDIRTTKHNRANRNRKIKSYFWLQMSLSMSSNEMCIPMLNDLNMI